jgi:hypothetical protein
MTMMMVRAGHLGGHVSHRHVLASEWFCSMRCARPRDCVGGVPMVGRSGAERAAMRKGFAMRTRRSAARCQPSATEMAAAAQAAAVSAAACTSTTTSTSTSRVSATSRAAAGTRAC